MRKLYILLSLFTISTIHSQNIAFNRLYGNDDPINYYLGHYPVTGSDGLDIHWYGGVKLSTGSGTALTAYGVNVGIGTENPKAKLDIMFPGEPKNILFMDSPTGTNTHNYMVSRMRFTWYNDTADFGMIRSGNTPIEGLAINFNDVEKIRFNSSGNVGLGVNNPEYKLVVGNGGDIALRANNGSNDAGDLIFAQGSGVQNARIWSYDGGGLFFSGRDNYPDFTISDNGNASLQGKLEAKEVKVTTTPTADFVFADDYKLPKLEEVERHIRENKHLPEIASAEQMKREGVNVGDFQIKLLQKIEELTLYIIEQDKRIKELESKQY